MTVSLRATNATLLLLLVPGAGAGAGAAAATTASDAISTYPLLLFITMTMINCVILRLFHARPFFNSHHFYSLDSVEDEEINATQILIHVGMCKLPTKHK